MSMSMFIPSYYRNSDAYVNRQSDPFLIENIGMSIGTRIREARKNSGLTQKELANKVGMKQPTLSELETGESVGTTNIASIASALGVNALWLETGKGSPAPINLVAGQSNVEPGPNIRGQVPLISWVAAGAFCESPENFAPSDAEKWLSCPVPHGKYAYCLRVVGKSMDNGDDGYRDGEIIFVDPDVEAMPGRDAIIRTPNGESTFKRLKQDVDGIYLQALNPRWEPNYSKMPEDSHICGVVIFAGRER